MGFMENAKCAGNSSVNFFAEDPHGAALARKFCEGCKVASECLAYAMDNEIVHGVWGGVSASRRKRMLAVTA